jgi:hypothetical protein
MQQGFRQYGMLLVKKLGPQKLGAECHAERLALLQSKDTKPEELVDVACKLAKIWRPIKAPKTSAAEQQAIEKAKTAGELESLDSKSREKAMLQIASEVRKGDLGNLAIARLHESLINPPKHARDQLQIVRTALELDGMLGSNPSGVHFHQHAFPPVVQQMLIDKMKELAAKEQTNAGGVIDAEIVPEGTTDANA